MFDGLMVGLHNIAQLSEARSRSISAENPHGEKGKGAMADSGTGQYVARELGRGWKISPSVEIEAHSTVVLADIAESGSISHIWMTTAPEKWRSLILRVYWDGEDVPSVEVPVGDFFCNGWCVQGRVNSLPIAVNPAGGFNSYFPMPFRKGVRMTLENQGNENAIVYYQVDYILTEVPLDTAYFHAQWRRNNPVRDGIYTILDGVEGIGHYVGTYLAVQVNQNGWWGEGEIKFYMDGDVEYPTICGTGTEDYFGGAWNFEQPRGMYGEYSTPWLGMHQVIKPDGLYVANTRFGMYRFHIMDPIRFRQNLKVTIQDLGWRSESRYLVRQDDMASVAYWYQAEPHNRFPELPGKDELEVI